MSGPLDHLDALERALTAKGFPAMSRWWRSTLTGFYRAGRRQLVIRAGRRAGKSSSLCRVGVLEALYGQHRIPSGDVGIVGIVSVSRDEAFQRLRTIRAILDVLGIGYAFREKDGTIELAGRPVIFKVFTASTQGVVGGTWICAICDEVARWRDVDTGANPARAVLSSLRPSLATMPNAKVFLSSSPWGVDDAHARAFDDGDTDFQSVAYAPTWEANPTLTEADTRALEPDERAWSREYAANPQADVDESLIGQASVDAVTRKAPLELPGVPFGNDRLRGIASMDPATRGNAWSLAIAIPDGALTRVALVREWRGSRGAPLSPETTLKEIATTLKPYGVREVATDQWGFDPLNDLARQVGVTLKLVTRTASSRLAMFERLRGMINQQTIELPPHEQMRRDLLGVRKRLQPGGTFTIVLPETGDGRHADLADALSLLANEAADAPMPIHRPDWLDDPFRPHPNHYRLGNSRGF